MLKHKKKSIDLMMVLYDTIQGHIALMEEVFYGGKNSIKTLDET